MIQEYHDRRGPSLLHYARSAPVLFYATRFTSQLGQGVFLAALFFAAGSGGHMAAGLSGVLVAMMAASIIAGMPAGIVGDRVGPANGLAIGAWSRLAVIATAVVLPADPAFGWLIAFAYSAVSQLFSASELALIRHLDSGRPARGHALLVVLQYAGQAGGLLALAPLLYWLGGVELMLIAAAVIYAGVGTLTLALRSTTARALAGATIGRTNVSLGPTLRFFADVPNAAYAAGVLTFFELMVKAMVVAVPVFLASELQLDRVALALLALPVVAGGAAGFLLASYMRSSRADDMMRTLFVISAGSAGLLAAASTGALDFTHGAVLIAALVPLGAAVGLALTLAPIAARAVLTHRAPIDQQSRVFATQGFITNVAVILPLLLAGIGTEVAGAGTTFTFLAIIGAVMLIALELALLREPASPVAIERHLVEPARSSRTP